MFKSFPVLIVSVFSLLFASFSSQLESANLHVLLIGDTNHDKSGLSFSHNLLYMCELVNVIAKETGLDLNLKLFFSNTCDAEVILEEIGYLNVKPDDTVICYSSSHGFRTNDKQDPWPYMDFNSSNTMIDFKELNACILSKKPRFLLSIADCCNSVAAESLIPLEKPYYKQFSLESKHKQNFKRLFLQTKGFVIISSSEKESIAWHHLKLGSIYTLVFSANLLSKVYTVNKADWHSILENTQLDLTEITQQLGAQTAQYCIEIE